MGDFFKSTPQHKRDVVGQIGDSAPAVERREMVLQGFDHAPSNPLPVRASRPEVSRILSKLRPNARVDAIQAPRSGASRAIRLYARGVADSILEGRNQVLHEIIGGNTDEFVEVDEAQA